jgi:hypothetical protein
VDRDGTVQSGEETAVWVEKVHSRARKRQGSAVQAVRWRRVEADHRYTAVSRHLTDTLEVAREHLRIFNRQQLCGIGIVVRRYIRGRKRIRTMQRRMQHIQGRNITKEGRRDRMASGKSPERRGRIWWKRNGTDKRNRAVRRNKNGIRKR